MKRLYFGFITTVSFTTMVVLFQNCGNFESADSVSTNATIAGDDGAIFESAANESENAVAIGLYRRLAGVTLPIDDPIIKQIEALIVQEDAKGAAEIAVQSPNFINITVRDFATKMSTRGQTVTGEFNDFVATVMGVVRDDVSATNMLTGNFFYRVQGQEDVAENLVDDIITSNRHYTDIDSNITDISSVLVREDGQKVLSESDAPIDLPDPAGLMTTRGWMGEHALAGTNRRLIEYAFKVFACTPIESWASNSRSDEYVGRDVGRFNLNDNGQQVRTEFDNKCKSCHAGMDALRPATAYFDYEEEDAGRDEGYIKYRYVYANDPNPNNANQFNVRVPASEQEVPYKFRRGIDEGLTGNVDTNGNPEYLGFAVTDDNWVNLATSGQFGFRLADSGKGMGDFARLIATSKQFSRCMTQRVFKTVCRQDVQPEDRSFIEALAENFERDRHNLKNLFVSVATHPACMGLGR